jgi:transcriptional regulator with XRE-family HTH domain
MKKETGHKIRQIRELKGYSQEYVASKLGISQRAYSKIETNQTKIDWERITKIAELFEVDPIDMISFDDNLIFNNCNQSGKFETFINNMPERLIEQYEKRIEELSQEVHFLRRQIEKASQSSNID